MAFIRDLPEARNFNIGPDTIGFDAEFFVWDALNEIDVQNTVAIHTPPIYLSLIRQKINAKEIGPGMWMVKVPYGTRDPSTGVGTQGQATPFPQPPGGNSPLNNGTGPTIGFDTAGEMLHITQSLNTRSKSTVQQSGTATIDTNKAINVSADRVEGCDIYGAKLEFTVEIPLPFVSLAYIIALYQLTGCVNYRQRFNGFDLGEVLYMGASGRYTIENRWVLSHRYAMNPNRRNIRLTGASLPTGGVVGTPDGTGVITVPFKAGWDYMWCEYVSAKVGNRMMQVPSAAYVEEVYPTGDFSIVTGGPIRLQQLMGPNGDIQNIVDLSKRIGEKIRHESSNVASAGTLVEWKWSDPNLPDNP
jgi:hypothetical protein